MRDFRSDRFRRPVVIRPAPAIVSGGALGRISGLQAGLEPGRIAQVEALELRREQSDTADSRTLMRI
jgi:hypothetical protein